MIPNHLLAVVTFILSLTTSQYVPIDLDDWETITIFTNAHSANCETLGGYNYQTNKIQIYGGEDTNGGSDQAKYVFDTTTRDYEYENLTYLTENEINIVNVGSTTQRHGATADNILYFFESSGEILGIDMNDDTITTYKTFGGQDAQTAPGLCMDDENNILYSVGDNQIITCNMSTQGDSCSAGVAMESLFKLEEVACVFYEGNITVFGGNHEETGEVNTVYECDPTRINSCKLTTNLQGPRKGINAVTIRCFGKYTNYIALLGGTLWNQETTEFVEIYDLKSKTEITDTIFYMAEKRRRFSAVYDEETDAIFVFGGNGNLGSTCYSDVQVTVSGTDGLCFTLDPTMDPTTDPTNNPTTNPTATPSVDPSSSPVKPPSIPSTNVPYKPQTEDYSTPGSAYGIIITILVLICCIILCCFFWYSREENDHVYDRMPVDMGVVAGGAAVPLAVVTYCDSCSKPTPCSCNSSCGKCGKSSCNNECGYKCTSCGTTSCDGRACNQTATTQ